MAKAIKYTRIKIPEEIHYFKRKWTKLSNQQTELAEGIKTHDTTIYCLQKAHFRSKDLNKLKVKGLKKLLNANSNQNRPSLAILISCKIGFLPSFIEE